MEIKYLVDVHVNDEYADDVPSHASIVLKSSQIKRIRQISRICKSLKAYCIQDWDYTPDWKVEREESEFDDWEGAIDVRLVVTDSDFFWEGYLKHTNIEISTGSISLKELYEKEKIMRTKKENLPLLIGKNFEFESSKKLIEERIANG